MWASRTHPIYIIYFNIKAELKIAAIDPQEATLSQVHVSHRLKEILTKQQDENKALQCQ